MLFEIVEREIGKPRQLASAPQGQNSPGRSSRKHDLGIAMKCPLISRAETDGDISTRFLKDQQMASPSGPRPGKHLKMRDVTWHLTLHFEWNSTTMLAEKLYSTISWLKGKALNTRLSYVSYPQIMSIGICHAEWGWKSHSWLNTAAIGFSSSGLFVTHDLLTRLLGLTWSMERILDNLGPLDSW